MKNKAAKTTLKAALWTLLIVAVVFGGAWALNRYLPAKEQPTVYTPDAGLIGEADSTCKKDSITNADLLALTNAERVKNGLPVLIENALLDEAAALKAKNMVEDHYWGHVNPKYGIVPWHWFTKAGYNYQFAGENLAQAYDTANAVTVGWMGSPGHRANILKLQYTEVGFAVVCGTTNMETTLIVAEYGSPK